MPPGAAIQIAVGHRALDFGCTAHRVDNAGEFREHAVAGGLDDPAVMLADPRVEQFDEMRLDAFVRAFFIGTHQTRIAHHVGGEDRGKAAFDTFPIHARTCCAAAHILD
jgi:hypothetical protein